MSTLRLIAFVAALLVFLFFWLSYGSGCVRIRHAGEYPCYRRNVRCA